ncbi:MAG: hypothetical protein U9Q08_01420 [Candidatus Omnitrophota bacterium]|nr:hypothetical protein [Candidatus Omnitrophota bacterium]
MKKILRFLLGLLAIPIAAVASRSLYGQLALVSDLGQDQLYFLGGVGGYLIIHSLFYKPSYFYVVGHELTHVIFTWFCGGKVRSFRAMPEGGEVTTTKSNFFIVLGPYFFPFYTVLVCCVYLGAFLFFGAYEYVSQFIFLVGFSWAFHVVFTAHFIKMKQPDILRFGTLFSISVIYIINLAILVFILSLLFAEVSFLEFVKDSSRQTLNFYQYLVTGLLL